MTKALPRTATRPETATRVVAPFTSGVGAVAALQYAGHDPAQHTAKHNQYLSHRIYVLPLLGRRQT